jgi:hypothetical protein
MRWQENNAPEALILPLLPGRYVLYQQQWFKEAQRFRL